MPDRLEDLRRQRALVQQQLEWLDREIAALSPAASPMPVPAPAPVVAPLAARPAPVPDLPEYHADPATIQNEARRGCFIYTAIAFAVFFSALAVIYFLAYRDHPLFLAEKPAPAAHPPK